MTFGLGDTETLRDLADRRFWGVAVAGATPAWVQAEASGKGSEGSWYRRPR